MTKETKRVLDAPWKIEGMIIRNKEDNYVCSASPDNIDRLARLPELYDKLMWAAVQHCPDAFLTLDECRLCPDKKCKYREIDELLKKVRDGK